MTASRDPLLYQGLCRLHRQLWQEPEPLAREVACHQFSRQLLARLTPASWDDQPATAPAAGRRTDAGRLQQPLTLAQLSAVAGLTPPTSCAASAAITA